MFDVCSSGIVTSRDTWVYNFSYKNVSTNISRMINFYNEQVSKYLIFCSIQIRKE
ncbi:type ISP restriction/modification enzyme [Microcystis aeruginosa]|uniref:type ISP restriction/modification enzyme n=1 Tax=Microcystis aeruginosa TaxID=1126 RepID=UPI0034D20B20